MLMLAAPAASRATTFEPPVNDAFASPVVLNGESALVSVDTASATSEPAEAAAFPGVGASVWYQWTAPADTMVSIDLCDKDFDAVLGVFVGSSLSSLSQIGSSSSCSVEFGTVSSLTLRIAVAGRGGATGTARLKINPPPVHDAFAAATEIEPLDGIASLYSTNRSATREPLEPDHASGGGSHSVWYRWTASRDGLVTIDTCSFTSFDTALAVYTGTSLAQLEPVAQNDDGAACLSAPKSSSVTFAAVAGREYRIAVDGHGSAAGTFSLTLHGPPLNDDFADARDLTEESGHYGTIAGATKEAGERDHGGDPGGHSVWFTWRATRSRTVTISTCLITFEPLLAVYTGSALSALTPVATAAPVQAEDCAEGKQISFEATAGTTYRIALDGKAGATGTYDIELPPTNDDFAQAVSLTQEDGYAYFGGVARATRETGEPDHGGTGHSVWHTWTATTDQTVTLDTCLSEIPTALAVYTGTAVTALTKVTGGGPGFCTATSGGVGVTFAATAGTTYRIAVDARTAIVGYYGLQLSTTPGNDAFTDATALTGTSIAGFTRGATKEPGEPDHAGNPGGHSVWYRWTAPSTGSVTLEACGAVQPFSSYFDTVLAVYAGSAVTALTPVASNNDAGTSCSFNQVASAVTFPVTAGTTYRIAVDGFGGETGSFTLSFPPGPLNDAFASAPTLTGSFANVTATTAGASKEAGEPNHAGNAGGHSVWYGWTAPTSGRYVLDTCSATFDTLLAVYTGSVVGALTAVGANDDAASCGPGSTGSMVTFTASAGTSYRIAIDGRAGGSGNAQFALAAAPGNDDFFTGPPLSVPWTMSTKGATRQDDEPQHAGQAGGASVWWSFTPTTSGPVTISTCPAGGFTAFDTLLAVYTGFQLANLTPVAANDDSDACGAGSKRSSVTFQGTAYTTYRIAVDGKGGAAGLVSMDLVAKPRNDDFLNAFSLFGDTNAVGSTRTGTREPGEPAHAGDASSPTVWYRWSPGADATAIIETCSSTADTILAVYVGASISALTPVTSTDDTADCGSGRQSRVTFQARADTFYWIAVAGKDAVGTFSMSITSVPTNDAFAAALALVTGAITPSQSNRLATRESGEPDHAGNAGGHSLWYSWTAPETGRAFVDACSASLDTLLAVYTGAGLEALTTVAGSDDSAACSITTRSRVSFAATKGTVYRIAVDGKDGATGTVSLLMQMVAANDDFAGAIEIDPTGSSVSVNNVQASAEPGEPAHAGVAGGRSLWYRWTPANDTSLTLDTCASSFDTLLAVYTGTAVDALTPVASADDGPCGTRAALSFRASAGTTYWIAMDGKAGATGYVTLSFIVAPANDAFAAAEEIYTEGGSSWGRTTGATSEPGEPRHAGTAGDHSLWYRWTAPRSGDTTLRTCSSFTSFDTVVAVYTGSTVDGLTQVAANDDTQGCGTGSTGSRLTFAATAGTTYRIAVDGKAQATGWFDLAVVPRPSHDDFAGALGVSYPQRYDSSNENATAQADEPLHAGRSGGHSVWFTWTANRSGDVRLATCTAEFDTLLAVYTGATVAALTPVASNDDSDRCGTGSAKSALTFTAAVGTTYRIAVDGEDGTWGTFTLQVGQPANDNFADAQTLTGRELTVTAATTAAGTEPGEGNHAGGAARNTVWYRWTAPVDGAFTLSTCDTQADTQLAVYRGNTLPTLTEVTSNENAGDACAANEYASMVTIQAAAGVEYRIVVGAYSDAQLRLTGPPANDAFADAFTLGSNLNTGSQTERNTNASREAGEPAAATHSVWYRWTAPRSGETTLDTCSLSTFDPTLAVFTGTSLAALTPVASGDGCGTAKVTFTAVAGTEYRIAVDGKAGQTGRFGLHFEIPPANDLFAARSDLGSGIRSTNSTNVHASAEPGEPQHAGVSGGRSVWYRWTADQTGRAIVDTCGSALDTLLAVYSGTAVGALIQLGANDDSLACAPGSPGSRVIVDVEAGATYAIAVDGKTGTTGTFALHVTPIPANDDFETATPIASDATSAAVETRGASLQPSEPAHAGRTDLVSVWYRWTAPVNGTVTLDACGSTSGAVVAVYTGSALATLAPVSAAANGCASFEAVAGTIYRIAVGTTASAAGAFTLAIGLPPVNDRFVAATRVSAAAAIVTGSTTRAGRETDEPAHAGRAAARSIWYRWTAPVTASVRISTCGSAFDTTLAVYTGSDVAALNPVASNDDSTRCGTGAKTSSVSFAAVAGTDYAIAVDGTASGALRLIVNPPANDDFEDAAVLTGAAASATSTTLAATAQPGEPSHYFIANGSVWWAWTAPAAGTYAVSTCGSTNDTQLAVYRGTSLTALTLVGSNDSAPCTGGGARVTFTATAGTQYRFAVDQLSSTPRGSVVLTLNAPTNDLFSAPTPLTGTNTTATGTNVGASVKAGEPTHAGNVGGASVWFTWTAPSSGLERVSTCGASFDTLLAVYTGSSLGALTGTASNDDGCGSAGTLTFTAIAGTTYRVAVDGKNGATGTFTLALERVTPANDAFASATALAGAAPTASQTTGGATAESGEPAHAGVAAARSVWFRWTAPANATMQIDTCGSDYDTRLAVYTGTALGALTAVASDDDGAGCAASTAQSRVAFAAVAGREYRIAVDGAATGQLVLRVNRPANDDRADALPAASISAGSTVGATRETFDTAAATVWYRWTAPADGPVGVATTCPGAAATALQVYDQGAFVRRLNATGCDVSGSTKVRGTFTATAGNVYLITVGLTLDGPGGAFVLRVGVPANDDLADATVLAGTRADVSATNVAASAETGEPLAGGGSVWYAWTAPASGPVTVDTCGSAIDTLLGVYTGTTVDALTSLALNDDPCSTASRVTFNAAQGTRYLIAVDGKAGAQGAIALHLDAAVDSTPPDTTITSAPPAAIATHTATIAFTATEAGSTFQCALDGAAFATCSSPFALQDLSEGAHTLRLRAIDPAGNVDSSPAETTFTVDITPPQTTITSGPDEVTTDPVVELAFTADEQATFECSFNGDPYASCTSPFTRSGLDDGDYTFAVRAVDRAGNADPTPASRAFGVDARAPETTITAGPPHDIATRSTTVAFTADKPGTTFRCRLDDAAATACTSPRSLTGLADGPHRFTVYAVDRAGNEDATPAEHLFVVDGSPLTARAGDDRTVLAGETVAFDGSASRPLAGIQTYVWDFGDSTTATGATATHAYGAAGDYTVKLTLVGVGIGGDTAAATARVHVIKPAGEVAVTVRDEGSGAALGGADVVVLLPGGQRVQATSAGDGIARLHGLPDGEHSVYVGAPGHVPATTTVTVSGGAGSAAAALRAGPVGAVTLSVHRMTLQEIIAAGINPNDPANQNMYGFSARLDYGGSSHDVSGFTGSGGRVWCSNCPRGVSGRAHYPAGGSGPPSITWLVMDGTVRFLKEFFAVDLLVQNLAGNEFTFTGATATLNLPDGMALAPTAAGQDLTRAVADAPGQSAKGVTWYIRGDREGFYDLSVDYHASLAPFGTPVNLRGETDTPIHVWGASALQLVIDADEEVREGYPLTVRVGLKNVSDTTVYNAAVDVATDAAGGFLAQPRQRRAYSTGRLAAGATFWAGPYIFAPGVTGELDLEHSFARDVAGDHGAIGTVTRHTRVPALDANPKFTAVQPPLGDKIALSWDPIPGATQYQLYRTPNTRTEFPDDPVLSTTKTSVVVDDDVFDHGTLAVSSLVGGVLQLRHPLLGSFQATDAACDAAETLEWSGSPADAVEMNPKNCDTL
jgi:hypothetical protein